MKEEFIEKWCPVEIDESAIQASGQFEIKNQDGFESDLDTLLKEMAKDVYRKVKKSPHLSFKGLWNTLNT